jgi:hypothetical protein
MHKYALDAYKRVSEFEILLRRIIRWELMASEGRAWMLSLDHYYDEIESRIKKEKISGLYSAKTSELSYLTLNELVKIIFVTHWDSKFKEVFFKDKGLYYQLNKLIIPLRNKVAHFRVIEGVDLISLNIIFEVEGLLKKYYSSEDKMEFYQSSDPEWVDDLIDDDSVQEIRKCLIKYKIEDLLDDFSQFDGVRSNRFWPGYGLYKDNIFVELHYDGNSPRLNLSDWVLNNKFSISLISKTQSKIRVFWPISLGKIEIKKGLVSFSKFISSAARSNSPSMDFEDTCEYFVQQTSERHLSVAF